MDKDNKNPLNLDDDKIREIERKMSQSSNVTERQSGDFEGVNIKFPAEMAIPIAPPPPPPGIVEVPSIPISQPQTQTVIKNLRTYQGDIAELIKNKNTSVLSITLAEKKRQDVIAAQSRQPTVSISTPAPVTPPIQPISSKSPFFQPKTTVTPVAPPSTMASINSPTQYTAPAQARITESVPKKPLDPTIKKNIALGVVSIILIASGIGAIYGFYVLQKDETGIKQTTEEKPIISTNAKTLINVNSLTKTTLIEKINGLRETLALGNGEIHQIALEKISQESTLSIGTSELFDILETNAPAPLKRSFKPNFMLGFFGLSTSKEPFLLIEIDSFELAFSGMLSWESSINDDVGSIFTRRVVTIKDTSSQQVSTTTTPSSSSSPQTRIVNFDNPSPEGFEDVTIRNKDARVLKNVRGETILLYSFIDRKFLLITSDETILREIINKLVAEQQIR